MRTELKYVVFFNALAIIFSRLDILPDFISNFLGGASIGIALFLVVVSLLPKKTYDNLLYRKWITSRNS